MATIGQLLVNIDTNVAQFTRDMDRMSKSVDQATKHIEGALNGVKTAFIAVGAVVAAGGFLGKITSESAGAEKALRAVEQTIRSTGQAAGVSVKAVTDLSQALQKQTGVSDDALNSASALMLTFTNVSKKVFPDAIRAANDMSVALGQDMKSSIIQLGKALNDPIKGVSALQRVGVSLTSQQTELVKSLVKTGKTLEAQKLILDELKTEFGGAAAAARDTLGGALEALKNNVDDLFQAMGDVGNNGFRRYVETAVIVVEDMTAAVEKLGDQIKTGEVYTTEYGKTWKELQPIFATVGEWIKATINTTIILSKSAMDAAIDVGKCIQEVFGWIGTAAQGVVGIIGKVIPRFQQWADEVGSLASAFAKTFVQELPGSAKDFNDRMAKEGKDHVKNFIDPIGQAWDGLQKRVDERMKLIQDAAAKYKGPKAPGDNDGVESKEEQKAREKLEKQIEKEREAIDKVVESMKERTATLDAQLHKTETELELAKAISKIEQNRTATEAERLLAITQVSQEYEKQKQIKHDIAVDKEEESLKKLLQSLEKKSLTLQAQVTGEKEVVEQLELQAQLEDIIKEGKGEHVELVERILKKQKEIAKQEKEVARDKELKDVEKIVQGYEDQALQIQLKAQGQEEYLGLIQKEREIMEKKNLTDSDKSSQIQSVRDSFSHYKQVNDTLKEQERLIDDITSSSKGYYNQTKDLQLALDSGRITTNQYDEAMRKLSKGTKEASQTSKEFAETLTKGLEDAVFEGKSLNDTFKEMGKELLKLTARKLIFDPLKEKLATTFDALGRNIFGLGKNPSLSVPTAPTPGLPAGAGQTLAYGGGILQVPPLNPVSPNFSTSAPVQSHGPVNVYGGNVILNGTDLGSLFGGGSPTAGGLGGSSLTGGTGGLFGGIGNIFSGITGSIGNLFSGVRNTFSGLTGGISNLFSGAKNLLTGGLGGLFSYNNPIGSSIMGMNLGGKPIGDWLEQLQPGGILSGGGIGGMVSKLLSGLGVFGGIGGGGGIGSLFGGLGGLLNIPQALRVAFQPASGLMGGLGGLGGLLNIPQALRVAMQPASGLFSGLKGLGGLLNFPQALGVALGPLFGGARARGGELLGGKAYLTSEAGPELFFPRVSGSMLPSNLSDAYMSGMASGAGMSRGEIASYLYGGQPGLAPWQGTPQYRQSGATPNFGGEWQAQQAYEKIQAWQNLSPMEKTRIQANEPWRIPTPQDQQYLSKGMQNRWKGGLDDEFRQIMNQYSIIQGQALIDSSSGMAGGGFDMRGNLGQQMINRGQGGFFSDKNLWAARGGIGLWEGNQNGNFLTAARAMGIPVSDALLSYANTGDNLYDVFNPTGIMPTMFAMGSKEGMGGVGSGALSQVAESAYVDPRFVTYGPGRGNYHGPTSNAPPPKVAPVPPSVPPVTIPNLGRPRPGQPAPAEDTRPVPARIFPQPSMLDERWKQFPGTVGQGDRKTVEDVLRDQQYRRAPVPPEAGISESLYKLWELSQKPGSPYSMLSQDQWYQMPPGPVNTPPLDPLSLQAWQAMNRAYGENLVPSMGGLTGGMSPGGVRGVDSGGWGLATPDVFQRQTPVMTTGAPQLYYPGGSAYTGPQSTFNPPNLLTGFSTAMMDMAMLGRVKGFASGGSPEPYKLAKVGERGQEYFMTGTRGQIISRQTAEQTLSKAGGGVPNVYVTNATSGEIAAEDVQQMPDGSLRLMIKELRRAKSATTVRRS